MARTRLSSSVASAAGPYGYTISLGGSIALASGRLGHADLGDALLLMLGAVAAFVALEVVAQSSTAPGRTQDAERPSVWGNAHVPSAGAALCLVWALVHLVRAPWGWLVTGFAATAAFFLVTTAQHAVRDEIVRRRAGG